MKITELKCSACNGTMKIDPDNADYAVCEYCGAKYLIERDDAGVHSSSGELNPSIKRMQESIYTQNTPREPERSFWQLHWWKWALGLILTIIIGVRLMINSNINNPNPPFDPVFILSQKNEIEPFINEELAAAGISDDLPTEKPELVGILRDFAEFVFEQPAENITAKQLADIQWMQFEYSMDFLEIGYSMQHPLDDPEAELTWIQFPRDIYSGFDLSCLPMFTGLKKLVSSNSLLKEDVHGLSLESVSGYFDGFEDVAALVSDAASIREITLTGDMMSLQGAEQFPNLEILRLDCDSIEDPKTLVTIKSLKSLSVDMYDEGMDFSVLGMMPWLEKVTISSMKLKDFSFVSSMSGLKELNLINGTFLNLNPLNDCTGLEALSVERCNELKDLSALSGLTNLKKLRIDLPYGCPEPDLSALTAMEDLYLEGFEKTSFLQHMPQLKTMTLDSCRVDESSDFDGLVNLTTLNCTSYGVTERDYGFITKLPALQYLYLGGTTTYKDISDIFNHPTLKYLDIGNMQCEINFDNIRDNTSLETLVMDHMTLYNNVFISGGNGAYSIYYDDVSLMENLSFLEKFKALKYLSIRQNELTDLNFAASLPTLRSIDFSDNYVTDLSPLSALKMLSEINCTENPISNFEVLSESVLVIP